MYENKEVDTLRVALVGFSLITIIILFFPVGYITVQSMVTSQNSFLSASIYQSYTESLHIISIFMFLLPPITFFAVWLALPSLLTWQYPLQKLPTNHKDISDFVKKTASTMGISSPHILYTPTPVANCFNVGRTEKESTIVVSSWLLKNLSIPQLKAVLTHEMAHTKNKDITFMAYFTAARFSIVLFPVYTILGFVYISVRFNYTLWMYLQVPLFWTMVGFLTVVSILLIIGIHWFSRVRESAADARASLYIDPLALKRALYKLACAKSARTLFSAPLMVSTAQGMGGILSTHPPIYKRYESLDTKEYIINTQTLSFPFCLMVALGIFIFTQLVLFVFSSPYFMLIKQLPPDIPFIFISPLITAGLLAFYFKYTPLKYIILIIFLVAVFQFVILFASTFFYYFFAKTIFLPMYGTLPAENKIFVDSILLEGKTLWKTALELLVYRIYFFVIATMTVIALKYKRYVPGFTK
ncbi:MAG: M48 family metalloprotease [Candidatus Methanofastidiosia archaeon]